MTTRTPGRHRAARRPITPLTPISRAAARGISTTARRSAIVAAGSGLIVSLLAGPADAAPVTEPDTTTAELDAVTLDAVKVAAQETTQETLTTELTTAPAVKVAADSKFALETGTIEVTPAPEPEPEPVVEVAEEEVTATAVADEPAAEEEAAPAASSGSEIVDIAMQYLGVPYVWAGATPAGFDCSGFTSYVYAQVGINLPHSSAEQRYSGTVVSEAEAQPGDLIWTPGHVAIYAGDGMQVEAPVPGETVRYDAIWQSSPTFIRVG